MRRAAGMVLSLLILGILSTACSRDEAREPAEAKLKGRVQVAHSEAPAAVAAVNILKAVLEKQGFSAETPAASGQGGWSTFTREDAEAVLTDQPPPAGLEAVELGPVLTEPAAGGPNLRLFARPRLQEDMPDAYHILSSFRLAPSDVQQVMEWNREQDVDPFKNGMRWVDENPEKVARFLPPGGNQ